MNHSCTDEFKLRREYKVVECDILAIGRAVRFSPNSMEKDAAILADVCRVLESAGINVRIVNEADTLVSAAGYISMGRLPGTLDFLREREREGKFVVNSAGGTSLCCNRRLLNARLREAGIPLPPDEGSLGYWLKRASGTSESAGDVQFAATREEMLYKRGCMMAQGMEEPVVQAHVSGDLIKFYGVAGQRFFRTYYPCDDGQWKFGDECRNGSVHRYPYSVDALQKMAELAAAVAGVTVYGGDCIIGSDGSAVLIDFNDWPSFSRCRTDAAGAIASYIINIYGQKCRMR